MRLLTFYLDDLRFALHLESVERVLRAVEITPLSEAPRNVMGLINVYGRIVPVFDLRQRLGLPAKEVEPSDQLVIARTAGRPIAFLVDGISGVEECTAEQETEASAILPGQEQIEGIARLGEGMVIIEDLDQLCSQIVAKVVDTHSG